LVTFYENDILPILSTISNYSLVYLVLRSPMEISLLSSPFD
jgi:hypothetical protein